MTSLTKNCSRCGQSFDCLQESGCWCTGVRLDPATLAELRGRFAGCLCEPCLRSFASKEPPAPAQADLAEN